MDNEQANRDRFNDIAAEWDEDPKRVRMAQAVAAAMLDALALEGGEQALEFGCGTGLITLQLAPRLARVTAMDGSTEMLEVLRRKMGKAELGNVILREGSVPGGLPDARYDLVFSSMTLHHVEDTEGLLRALFERLNPGGRIALADLDAEDGSFHGCKPGIAHRGFDRGDFERLLSRAGFGSIRFSTACTVRKEDDEGVMHEYPVFLAVANRSRP